MEWEPKAEALYSRIVARVPAPQRDLVASSLRRGAEGRTSRNHGTKVVESDVVVGMFESTPEAFHSQVRANLGSLGIDYSAYLATAAKSDGLTKIDLSKLLADLEEMSVSLGVPYEEAKMREAILAYGEYFEKSPVAMRMTTRSKTSRNLAVRYLDFLNLAKGDPLATAKEKGFVADDGHPVFALFEEAKLLCSAIGYGVDLDVSAGFSKIWLVPSVQNATLDVLAGMENLPQGAKNTLGHFARFGLNVFGLIGFDFGRKTMNLYFMIKDPASKSRDYGAQLSDLGFPVDQAEFLDACRPAQALYYTFSWASAKTERVCFPVVCSDHSQVPMRFDSLFEIALGNASFTGGRQTCIYSIVWSQEGNYFKVDNDYSGTMASQLIEAAEVGV
jgi:hypothetical protein